ncbi:MAG TPA: acetate uptake transporter [Solirubrobacteraceae bacterium]|jgi:hypothetical protein|nr:acetate uptake transporter [Solirubrobacteraceae bacterium]
MREEPWVPANPAPLGLAGFGITTLILSLVNANLIGMGAEPVVLGLAIAYGGLAQFMAGMWEFRTGNTFGATAFTSYGAFWISFFVLVTFDAKLIAPGEVHAALGAYLWAWGIFTAYMWLCSFRQPIGVMLVFLALAVTFILLGIGNSGGHTKIIHAGGWAGLVTAGLALYCSCGMVMRHQYGRAVLPFTGT